MNEHRPHNFLADIIEADLAEHKNGGKVVTRFPPEPNGFLHIGHAKSILLNFGLARAYGGRTHLRFDDTNPTKEDTTYVESIQEDVRWLGCDWGNHLYFASDFFERMFECGERLIREGHAYVDHQSPADIRENRGSFERPGVDSPFRRRSADESLDLFRRMRKGEFSEGSCVLRAKIDMAHPNVLMRDPLLYRIKHAHHHRTGDAWCIYPMYDFAHPLEDAIEGITHSICTLEFESNRELYDWVLDHLGPWNPRPHQYEFARLSLGYTVMSKRKLLELVTERHVSGWDDPRMPTIAGMRRRGVTPEALRAFAERIGVAKNNSLVDIGKLEFAIRADLENRAPRAMAVLEPLNVTISNWSSPECEMLTLPWWPGEPERAGARDVPFGRELLIEAGDFLENPPDDWKRLSPGREVRLFGAYVVRCDGVTRDTSEKSRGLRVRMILRRAAARRRTAEKSPEPCTGCTRTSPSRPTCASMIASFRSSSPTPKKISSRCSIRNRSSCFPAHASSLRSAARNQAIAINSCARAISSSTPIRAPTAPCGIARSISKDSWAKTTAPIVEVPPAKPKKEPKVVAANKKGRTELRAERRAETPVLGERFHRYTGEFSLTEDEADVLTGDLLLSDYFEHALAAHTNPKSIARWLLNELLGLADDGDVSMLRLNGADFGRFVALVDDGRIAATGAKSLLAHLAKEGGNPEARMNALGLAKREDAGALAAAIERVLTTHAAEVARYRAGEKKLLGVLLGAAMRETQGTAEASDVRKTLLARLEGSG